MPQETGSREITAALNETGAAYQEARTAILAWNHPRRAEGIKQLRAAGSWESRLTADILEGWIRHQSLFEKCLDLLKKDLPGPKPMTGYTPPVRGQAVAALGANVVPRVLELLWKDGGQLTSSEAAALFVALTILKDLRSLPLMRRILEQPIDPVRRRGAVLVLATLGNGALPDVVHAASLGEKDVSVRTASLQALHQFSDPRASAALVAAVSDTSRTVGERRAAATSLYKLADSETLRTVTGWLEKETDEEIQITLVMLVGRVGNEAQIAVLDRLSPRATDSVREVIRRAITEIQRREQR